MPIDLLDIDESKLAALQAIKRPHVAELVAIYWPEPDGTIYYSPTQLDELSNYKNLSLRPIQARLPLKTPNDPERFLSVTVDSGIGDEVVPLDFNDLDDEMSRLSQTHGEGVKVEIFYYFPQVDLLLSLWWAHLRLPDEANQARFQVKAQSGFRSNLLPLPSRPHLPDNNATVCGAHHSTQAEIDEGDCEYNRHLGGEIGNLDSDGQPFVGSKVCPQNVRADCILRRGDDKSWLGFETIIESVLNFSGGHTLLATSRGNENNLRKPLRVIIGKRYVRELDVISYSYQLNTSHPDQGFVRVLMEIGEGRLKSAVNVNVNGSVIGFEHLNVRLGGKRQSPTGFSPNVPNLSGTAHFFAVYGPVNPTQYNAGNLKGSMTAEGLDQIRVYTDENAFTEQYTTNRAWALLEMYRNKRWGHRVGIERFHIPDWIYLAAWCDQTVGYRDALGEHFTSKRSTMNVELNDRTAQQQINDTCLFGRFGLPFPYGGKIRILPLEKVTIEDSIPVFTDYGQDRNIFFDRSSQMSAISYSQISDAVLPNNLQLTFDDEAHNNVQRPLTFGNVDAWKRAGRAMGDSTIRKLDKPYTAFGITNLGEAVRVGSMLRDLGEFDTGGLENNLRVKFTTWYKLTLGLHKYKVIRILSRKLEKFHESSGRRFEYFRITSMQRRPDLKVEIIAQAYPVDYYERMEDPSVSIDPPDDDDNPGGDLDDLPCSIHFSSITHTNDTLLFRLEPC